jgi:hypothetical protein
MPQFAPECNDLLCDLVRKRHFVRIPARDGGQCVVCPLNKALHGTYAIQAHRPAANNKHIPRLQIANENFFHHAEGPPAQSDRDGAFTRDYANVLQQISADNSWPCLERPVLQCDLAEHIGVLLAQRFAAAGQEIERLIESFLGKVAIRVCPSN